MENPCARSCFAIHSSAATSAERRCGGAKHRHPRIETRNGAPIRHERHFLRALATPEPIKEWSQTTLKEKLIKIGANVVCHSRYGAFQMAEAAVSKVLFAEVLRLIAELRPPRVTSPA